MFVVIIRGWNCTKYLARCMQSLADQTCQDWRAQIMIDASNDGSEGDALGYQSGRVRVNITHPRKGVGHNLYYGLLSAAPADDDIVCILDADDWLYNYALAVVEHTYKKTQCLATYGSFELESSGEKSSICKPYGRHDEPRKAKWRASHLKTFKGKVFNFIPPEYMQHKGEFVPAASDLALMMSVMEVAGMRNCVHIPKVLYHYRNHTPFTQDRDKQRKYDKIIREKTPLPRAFN